MSATCTEVEHKLVTGARRRALVTLLFCDLRGFTPLAARLDPIEVHNMLTTYYETLSPVLAAHGGRVVQYTGDEIFAVFEGADDAGRALRAGMALDARLARLNASLVAGRLPALELGIGLHRGEVVLSAVAFGTLQQLTVMGDAVNVARRYCTAAEAGQVVFSTAVRDAVRRVPAHRTVPGVALKGVAEVVTVHVVLPPRPVAPCRPVSRRRRRRSVPIRSASVRSVRSPVGLSRGPPPRERTISGSPMVRSAGPDRAIARMAGA